MIRRPLLAIFCAALIGAVILLAGSPAEAQRQDSDWMSPPLKAIGKALGGLRQSGQRAGRAGKGVTRRAVRAITPPRRQARPAPPQSARLPRPRPTETVLTLAAAGPVTRGSQLSATDPGQENIAAEPPRPAAAGIPATIAAPIRSELAAAIPLLPAAAAQLAASPPDFSPNEAVEEGSAEDAPASRLPRPRPAEAERTVLAAVEPSAEASDLVLPPPPAPPAITSEEEACLSRLPELGVTFERRPPLDVGGTCPVAAPLEVSALGSGVEIEPKALMNCRTTEALALWVRDSLVPEAKKHLQAAPDRIIHASTYVCRPRNNEAGAKLSEHGKANAIDISGISFTDRAPVDIRLRSGDDADARFAAAISATSCKFFTTVLGPGSNAAHATHLHFDMAERRGGYRLCELGQPETAERAP